MIYLDCAATTPIPRAVADAMYEVLTQKFANPSAQYPIAREMKQEVERCRGVVSSALGCKPKSLYFTSCGTESDNWALRAACHQNRRVGKHVVTTAVEHDAVLRACDWLERDGWEVTRLGVAKDGALSAETVLDAVRPDTALVSVMTVNNELGTIYPIAEIVRGLKQVNPNTLLHTDAVQAFLKVPFSVDALGADFISLSAHKIGGPKGIGALYIGERAAHSRPLIAGGGQESGLRSGTEATAQIVGFAKAAELRAATFERDLAHLAALKAHAIEALKTIPDLTILSEGGASHILAVSLVGWPAQNIVTDLGENAGICISAGSACHRGKPSHVIAALGLPKKVAAGAIRLSFGPETTFEEIDACAEALRRHRETRLPML